jgi:hypothetical protein
VDPLPLPPMEFGRQRSLLSWRHVIGGRRTPDDAGGLVPDLRRARHRWLGGLSSGFLRARVRPCYNSSIGLIRFI